MRHALWLANPLQQLPRLLWLFNIARKQNYAAGLQRGERGAQLAVKGKPVIAQNQELSHLLAKVSVFGMHFDYTNFAANARLLRRVPPAIRIAIACIDCRYCQEIPVADGLAGHGSGSGSSC